MQQLGKHILAELILSIAESAYDFSLTVLLDNVTTLVGTD